MTAQLTRMRRRFACAVLLFALLLPALPVQPVGAGAPCVNPAGSGGCFSTIQAAIDDPGTVDGDTITVAPNNPLQPAYNEHVVVSKSVMIVGADKNTTIVDGTNSGPAFTINSGKTVHISAMMVQGGSIANNGTLTMSDSTIFTNTSANTVSNGAGSFALINTPVRANVSNNGGGVMSMTNSSVGGSIDNNGTLTLNDSDASSYVSNNGTGTVSMTNGANAHGFSNNGTGAMTLTNVATSGSIGNNGILTLNGTTMNHASIINNQTLLMANSVMTESLFARGIYNGNAASATITNSTLRGNFSGANVGGAIYNLGTLTLTNATLSFNNGDKGGGIYNAGAATVIRSTFDHNTASNSGHSTGGGGGIYNDVGATATLINSTLYGNNTGGSIGGGIVNLGAVTLINDTFSANDASQGGGIANYASLNLSNTIIAANTASGGGPDVTGSITSGGHNLIGTTSGGSGFVGSDLTNVNPQLGSLANNGGPTQTMALQVGSPAIGAADPTICAAAPPNGAGGVDQRGLLRPSGSCSIGAYEAQPLLPGPLPPTKPTAAPGGSPTALPPPRPTVPGPGAGTPTPNPLPPPRP